MVEVAVIQMDQETLNRVGDLPLPLIQHLLVRLRLLGHPWAGIQVHSHRLLLPRQRLQQLLAAQPLVVW